MEEQLKMLQENELKMAKVKALKKLILNLKDIEEIRKNKIFLKDKIAEIN